MIAFSIHSHFTLQTRTPRATATADANISTTCDGPARESEPKIITFIASKDINSTSGIALIQNGGNVHKLFAVFIIVKVMRIANL